MDLDEYHIYFDTLYNFMMEQEFLNNTSEFTKLCEMNGN